MTYSLKVGLWKTLKNLLPTLIPFFVALQMEVPAEYAWIPSAIVYFLKNWAENRN